MSGKVKRPLCCFYGGAFPHSYCESRSSGDFPQSMMVERMESFLFVCFEYDSLREELKKKDEVASK